MLRDLNEDFADVVKFHGPASPGLASCCREAARAAVSREPPAEEAETQEAWRGFTAGDPSPAVLKLVRAAKRGTLEKIPTADDRELCKLSWPEAAVPARTRIYQSLTCPDCGEIQLFLSSKSAAPFYGVIRYGVADVLRPI